MRFTVKRSEWLRGEGTPDSYLLRNRDEKRCCLGFMAKELGFDDAELTDVPTPGTLLDMIHIITGRAAKPRWRGLVNPVSNIHMENHRHTDTCKAIFLVNDDANLAGEVREAKLTKLFAKAGHQIIFVD